MDLRGADFILQVYLMSDHVEIISDSAESLLGLQEQQIRWGSELHSFSPRKFTYEQLEISATPLALHIKNKLPDILNSATGCLAISERIINEWRTSRLSVSHREALRRLFSEIGSRPPWAVVHESATREGFRIIPCCGSELFNQLEELIQSPTSAGLSLLLCIR